MEILGIKNGCICTLSSTIVLQDLCKGTWYRMMQTIISSCLCGWALTDSVNKSINQKWMLEEVSVIRQSLLNA